MHEIINNRIIKNTEVVLIIATRSLFSSYFFFVSSFKPTKRPPCTQTGSRILRTKSNLNILLSLYSNPARSEASLYEVE